MSAIMSAPKIGLQPSSNQVSHVTDSLDIKVVYVFTLLYVLSIQYPGLVSLYVPS
jgi:hypothetical protein